jgi:hypothetical protein
MARKQRKWGSTPLHLTSQVGNENKVMFRCSEDRQVFCDLAKRFARALGIKFLKIRLQPRGVLMLIGTWNPSVISSFESRLKGGFSRYLNHRYRQTPIKLSALSSQTERADLREQKPWRDRMNCGPVNWRPRFDAIPIERAHLEKLADSGWDSCGALDYFDREAELIDASGASDELLALELVARGFEQNRIPTPTSRRVFDEQHLGEPMFRVPNSPNWWIFAARRREKDERVQESLHESRLGLRRGVGENSDGSPGG